MGNVLVTFPADQKTRRVIEETLGADLIVSYLENLSAADRRTQLGLADALLSWHLARELQAAEFEALASLKVLQMLSAGVNHVPFSKLPRNLVVLGNSGAYSPPIAEHVIAMILAACKNLLTQHEKLRRGIFDQDTESRMLAGSNCAILGFGGIGKATARLLRCFGVKIYAINTSGSTDQPVEFVGTLRDLEHVLRLADIVVIALPLKNSTRGLIGKRELGWMKDDAILVNVARGPIVDEEALFGKLKSQPSFTAALEAWWIEPREGKEFRTNFPFLTLPNLIGCPHNSGIVPGAFVNGARCAAENLKRWFDHKPVLGEANRDDYS
ncbi:MAG TPA: 2-hydroxyacid dehydrogenase [Terriglobales bacterium]|nr:2-hydroxyacid dehydrogenase [Terriglobales bacterium]